MWQVSASIRHLIDSLVDRGSARVGQAKRTGSCATTDKGCSPNSEQLATPTSCSVAVDMLFTQCQESRAGQ